MQVLIVDNSIPVIKRLEEILSDADNIETMFKAVSYNEASMFLKVNEPDVVLLDISLPGNESLKLLKEIKETRPETSVIILFIYIDNYIMEQCKVIGADFILDKFYDFEKIPGIIKTLAAKYELVLQ